MAVLETFSELPIVSPLASIPDEDTLGVTISVGLSEITNRGLLHIRGNEAEAALRASAMKIGDVLPAESEEGLLARTRRDEFVLLTRDVYVAMERLATLIGDKRVTLTEITHGRCGILLVGSDAARVLPKVCGLDFSDKQFPNLHAAQTSLAKVRTLIIRADIDTTPAYGLIVDRSLAQYVWGVVYDAGQEFGIRRIDLDNTRARGLW
ncbi:MAG: sarcosine oxidase subunit gamma family protein [Chloroflexota bacterium]